MSERLDRAIEFALEVHSGQTRDDKFTPYIVHPLSVLENLTAVARYLNEDVACAAVLHDTIEEGPLDTDMRLYRIFGMEIADLVLELTLPEGITRDEKTRRLVNLIREGSPEAVLVKLCDRLDNIGSRSGWKAERTERYMRETQQMVNAFDRRMEERGDLDLGCQQVVSFIERELDRLGEGLLE